MNKILSKILNLLKYVLLIIAFALILYGMIVTYKRLEKPLSDAISVFLPFAIIFIMFLVNIFVKGNDIKDNLLYNFTCVLVFAVIIIICLRAKFDVNMLLYQKYQIDFNPTFLSDNLSSIKIILYCLIVANILFLAKVPVNKIKDDVVVELPQTNNNNNTNNVENNFITEENKSETNNSVIEEQVLTEESLPIEKQPESILVKPISTSGLNEEIERPETTEELL